MTMLERVGSYSNEYFNSLIREYTDKGKAPESHGMNRAIRAYLNTNDLKVNELLVDDMPYAGHRRLYGNDRGSRNP